VTSPALEQAEIRSKKAMIDFEPRNLKVAKGENANAGGLA
jgi:hypothetical protein